MAVHREARLDALDQMLDWAHQRVHESGGNNRGPIVEMIQRADSVRGELYPWCQATCNAAWRLATGGRIASRGGRPDIRGGQMLLSGTASVGMFYNTARGSHYLVSRPRRGDHACYHKTPGDWPYHVGMVDKVLALGPVLILRTVEGNTGPAGALDVSDPGSADGVFIKRRVIRRTLVSFVRVPGKAAA